MPPFVDFAATNDIALSLQRYGKKVAPLQLIGTFISEVSVLFNELDQQLSPSPPLDTRIKAIMLIHSARLSEQQFTNLALKRHGSQSFEVIADLMRQLDKPEAYLKTASVA